MDESTKADIFKSQIEQAVGKKLNNLVFAATYTDGDKESAVVSANGDLEDQANLIAILFARQPELLITFFTLLGRFEDKED